MVYGKIKLTTEQKAKTNSVIIRSRDSICGLKYHILDYIFLLQYISWDFVCRGFIYFAQEYTKSTLAFYSILT